MPVTSPISRVNDFVVRFANVNGSGSASANELFEVVKSGAVKIEIRQTYKLADIQKAHRDLEARKTTGSTVILP